MFITTAFSINMLPLDGRHTTMNFYGPLTADEFKAYMQKAGVELESAIGHANTAAVISGQLGITLPINRVDVQMGLMGNQESSIAVAQYTGPRLSEGAIELPEGAQITYWVVTVLNREYGELEHRNG